MEGYLSVANTMNVRTISFTVQEYIFCLQIVTGEEPSVAWALVYDEEKFKSVHGTSEEELYLSKCKDNAELLLEQQQCVHLKEILEQDYQAEIQAKANTLKDFKFTGADVQKLLNNLLKERSTDLSEASVRDILALVKSMYDSGALDSGENWGKHFISLPTKYNALCGGCNHEIYAIEGLDIRCPFCGQVYKWVEEEKRFYPKMQHL